jgi:hypothetical protein
MVACSLSLGTRGDVGSLRVISIVIQLDPWRTIPVGTPNKRILTFIERDLYTAYIGVDKADMERFSRTTLVLTCRSLAEDLREV